MNLWKLSELCAALGISCRWPDNDISSVHTDSRDVRPGGLFVALKGEKTHGNAFIPQALENGAVAVISDRDVPNMSLPLLVVGDSFKALVRLAEVRREAFGGPVVAITGSAGKTTTTQFLAAMLEAHAPAGSFNNHVGVPLTMCRLPRNAKAFVAEIGMNHPGEIAPLARMVRPHVALVVNVMPVHVAGLGSVEGIRREKLSIAEGLAEGGTLVVPEGLEMAGVRGDIRIVRFDPTAALPVAIVEPSPARMACANAALAVARVLGDVTPAMLERLAQVGAQAGRGAAEVVHGVTVIDDSFNGNPASMAAALQALARRNVAGRRVALLGDMLELGAGEVDFHKGLLPHTEGVDGLMCVGPLMRHLYNLLPEGKCWGYWENPAEVDYGVLAGKLKAGDAIVVKGSKKMLYVQNAVPKLKEALG